MTLRRRQPRRVNLSAGWYNAQKEELLLDPPIAQRVHPVLTQPLALRDGRRSIGEALRGRR